MGNIIFKPWVGDNYRSTSKKIFILGESHYGESSIEDNPDFTSGIVESFLGFKAGKHDHEHWMNTFTRFTNVVHDQTLEVGAITSFWQSIVFYNYIQKAIEGPRVSPSEQDFENSLKALVEIITEYQPNLIIIWGQRLWESLPNELFKYDKESNSYFLEIQDNRIDVLWIYHPSSRYFNYGYWKELGFNLFTR